MPSNGRLEALFPPNGAHTRRPSSLVCVRGSNRGTEMGSTASVVYQEEEASHVTPFFSELVRVLREGSLSEEIQGQIRYLSKDYEQFQKRQVRDVLKIPIDSTKEGQWTEAATELIKVDPALEEMRKKLVPARMKDGVFWNKYFNCVFQLTANKAFSLSLKSGDERYTLEKEVALDAVRKASSICQAAFAKFVDTDTVAKKDKSPVTVADFAAQAVVINEIRKAFPLDPVVGEEDSSALQDNQQLRENVVGLVNSVYDDLGQIDEERVLRLIDYGQYRGGPKGRHWTVDPIDGTLGFLRGEQYAVCLALIENGKVVLGVLGCPNLARQAEAEGEKGCLFAAVKGLGATVQSLAPDAEATGIHVSMEEDLSQFNFVESVEAAHTSHSDAAVIAQRLGVQALPVRMDSQCKYAALARGDACIYLRLPARKHYEEKIWDHAAGWLIVREAGGLVTDTRGKELDFSIGRTLRDNLGVVASNGVQHYEIVKTVAEVLHPEKNYFLRVLGREQPSAEEVARVLHEQLGLDRRCVQVLVQVEEPLEGQADQA